MEPKNYSELIRELDMLMWETEKKKEYLFLFFVFGGGFFLFYLVSIGLAILLRDYSVSLWLEYVLIFLGLTVVPGSIIMGVLKIIEMKSENLKNFIEKTKSILYKYDTWKATSDDIESLLFQTREIHETVLFVYKFYKKNRVVLGDALFFYIKDFEQSTLKALYDIQSDLEKEFGVRKEKLSQAQNMLESESPNGLKNFTKAQSTRLDEEIRQFEKLDEILIRM